MSRPPKPSALKVVGGTDRKDRRNGKEPEFSHLSDLSPPPHLAERSAAVWVELASTLRRAHVLTEADLIAFEMLCDAVADYRYTREQRGDEFTTPTRTGSEQLSQLLIAQQMAGKRAETFMAKFGMDPASRTRIMVDPQGDLFGGGSVPPGQKPTGTSRFFAK